MPDSKEYIVTFSIPYQVSASSYNDAVKTAVDLFAKNVAYNIPFQKIYMEVKSYA